MAFGPSNWLGRLRSLGNALVELLRAEAVALSSELRGSAVLLRRGVVSLMIAGFFAFWTVGALAYGAVEVLSFWLPRWGAALSCAGLLGFLALIFALVGKSRLKKLESPARTVAKRVESHSLWVQNALLSDGEPERPEDRAR